MAIKSNITRTNALGNSIDSGKNPNTLEEKSGFLRYIHAVADQVGNGDPIASEDKVIDYTKKYHPGSVADVTEYYASFNPSSPKTTKGQTYVPEAWKSSPKPVEGISPPNFETNASGYEDMDEYYKDLASGKINAKGEVINPSTGTNTSTGTTSNTGTGTSTNASYDELLANYENLLKQFDELSKSRAVEGHNIYKDQMSSASGYTDDFAKWLQGVRDIVMKEAQANPLETDWGKGILDYYGVLGENSANAVNAATAGENAGNIDSFAAANAERQRVSKLGQGIQSVMGMSAERFNNMIAGLNSIGVNTDLLFGAQQDLVDTSAGYAADLYKTDADSTNQYNQLMAQIESGSNPYIALNDDQVKAALMDAYAAAAGGDVSEIDWANTDDETWDEALKDLMENEYISRLSATYLKNLRNQIKQAQSETASQETESTKNETKKKNDPNWWWLNSMWT